MAKEKIKCVDMANKSPDKLNEEGKRNLAHDILEEISVEKIKDFVKKWGYLKK